MLLGMHKNDDVADKAVTQTTITITEFEDEWGWNWDSTSCRMDTRSSEFVREKFVHVEREDNDSCTSTTITGNIDKSFRFNSCRPSLAFPPTTHTPPILLLLRSSVPVRSCCEVLSIFSGRPPRVVVVDVIKKSVGASECEAEGGGKFKSR